MPSPTSTKNGLSPGLAMALAERLSIQYFRGTFSREIQQILEVGTGILEYTSGKYLGVVIIYRDRDGQTRILHGPVIGKYTNVPTAPAFAMTGFACVTILLQPSGDAVGMASDGCLIYSSIGSKGATVYRIGPTTEVGTEFVAGFEAGRNSH